MPRTSQTTSINLPLGRIGVSFRGRPPQVSRVSDDSPVRNQIRVGQYPVRFSTRVLELSNFPDTTTLVSFLFRYQEFARILVVSDEEPCLTEQEPLAIRVMIPPSPIGLRFATSPDHGFPVIKVVRDNSPIRDVIERGLILQSIVIPGEGETSAANLEPSDVVKMLMRTRKQSGRVLVFHKPRQEDYTDTALLSAEEEEDVALTAEEGTGEASPPPTQQEDESDTDSNDIRFDPLAACASEDEQTQSEVDTSDWNSRVKTVSLPHGRIGAKFCGKPPRITGVFDDSPVRDQLRVEQYPIRLTIGSLELSNFPNATVLVSYLCRYEEYDRVLAVSDEPPETQQPRLPLTFRVTIPPSRIGVTFGRSQNNHSPMIMKVAHNSPLRYVVESGLLLQSIEIPGEGELIVSDMTSTDVVTTLSRTQQQSGRVLVFHKKGDSSDIEAVLVSPNDETLENVEHAEVIQGPATPYSGPSSALLVEPQDEPHSPAIREPRVLSRSRRPSSRVPDDPPMQPSHSPHRIPDDPPTQPSHSPHRIPDDPPMQPAHGRVRGPRQSPLLQMFDDIPMQPQTDRHTSVVAVPVTRASLVNVKDVPLVMAVPLADSSAMARWGQDRNRTHPDHILPMGQFARHCGQHG